ncbi:MAG: hypothetical protein LC623_08320 [Halobacteriales archaeon]|nr:hypothetical protein [Halobacteriales archaeon]
MRVHPLSTFSLSLLACTLLLAGVPAAAQSEGVLFDFRLDIPEGLNEIPVLLQRSFTLTFTDASRDGTSIVPGAPPLGATPHHVEFRLSPGFNDTTGWQIVPPGGFDSFPGQVHNVVFDVLVFTTAENPYYRLNINTTITTADGQTFHRDGSMLFFTKGIAGFTVRPGSAVLGLKPREIAQADLRVVNFGSLPRAYDFEMVDNPCELGVGPPASVVVQGKGTRDVQFSVQGPATRFDLLGAPYCLLTFNIVAHDNPSLARQQTVTVQLAPAIALDPLAVFYFFAALLLLVLLVLFLRRRKERLEEEILGKPQKPWTIPVEQVYLRHLKAKDQRAWYVVRHYLMEDEYRSALLWYKAYKKATRGDRRRERLVLAQERSYARWKAGWEKDIAKPVAKADRFEAKLQGKLDRKARKTHRKATRRWRKAVRKLEAKRHKKVEREQTLHAKLVARARKKGLPEPEPLQVGPPELPPQPAPRPRPLAEHRWARKAARQRKRMLRKQGNLEVRFERADARKQLQLQRKVEKLSRDIGDAGFVAQHATQQQ